MNRSVGTPLLTPLLLLLSPLVRAQAGSEPVEHTYATRGSVALKAYVFSPSKVAAEPAPAVVVFHGGGWTIGEPQWAFPRAQHFADRGMVAVAAQYRLSDGKAITPLEAMADARSVIRWLRDEAAALGVDPRRIAAYGWSAGAHLAASAAIFPDGATGTSASPAALILVSPAVSLEADETARGLLAGRTDVRSISPDEHVRKGLPPTLILQGSEDTVTPLAGVQRFCDRLRAAGNDCELHVYSGFGHLFTPAGVPDGGWPQPDPATAADALARSDRFLESLGYLSTPEPTQDDPHAACAMPKSYVPAELLERALPLRSGVGNSHETVTSGSSAAQAYYDQGLNYLESYVWIEASRSFHQALRLDPKLALALVGLSRVHSGLDDSAGAKRYFLQAKALASGTSDRERRRIEIRERQLEALDALDALEDSAQFLAYKKAIDDALTADFEDPELWILRGTAEEGNASGRGQRGTASSIAFYQQVLRLVPEHATAHHYLVHSYETIGRIDEALAHGEVYARLAPSIPHAAHMWAHDLRRVGRIDEAIVQFQKVDSLERAYYETEQIDPALDWHHGHNLDLLATCYEHRGQMRLAEQTLREAESLAAVDAYRAFNRRALPGFLIHRARYGEALEAARALTRTDYPQARSVGHALAGQALIGLGRIEAAGTELEAARLELDAVPRVAPGLVPRRNAVEPWVEALHGELLLRTGKQAEGRAILQEVQRALRAIPGPDQWSQALFRLEAMARSGREAGDWELADSTARQMLEHDAAYGGSHLALAFVLQQRGDAVGAERAFETAQRLWRDADPDLPELSQIAAALAARR